MYFNIKHIPAQNEMEVTTLYEVTSTVLWLRRTELLIVYIQIIDSPNIMADYDAVSSPFLFFFLLIRIHYQGL